MTDVTNPWIVRVNAVPWDIPMRSPYRSAQRITTTAHNVLVRVEFDDGSVGFGESAPAQYVTGETQELVLARIQAVAPALTGLHYFAASRQINSRKETGAIQEAGARGALEMALDDAFAHSAKPSILRFWDTQATDLVQQQTDLSLPLLPAEEARIRAAQAAEDGYRALKIKIGGPDMEGDEARVRAVADAAPNALLRLDGNQGFSPENAVRFMERLADLMPRIQLLEQPTKAGDDAALLFVQSRVSVPVFADEAVHNQDDAARLLAKGACKGVVLKLAKSGIRQTIEIAETVTKAGGLLLFGCMMETRLGISAALQLAAAIASPASSGKQPLLDLDGHLLTSGDDFVSGGFTQTGDVLTFDPNTPGLGVAVVWPPPRQ